MLEQVHLDSPEQKVSFIGAAKLNNGDGNLLCAGTRQPLFHVKHWVDGDELRPLNMWSIVHLTEGFEQGLIEPVTLMDKDVWLPEFIEIYIQKDLGINLSRRDIS